MVVVVMLEEAPRQAEHRGCKALGRKTLAAVALHAPNRPGCSTGCWIPCSSHPSSAWHPHPTGTWVGPTIGGGSLCPARGHPPPAHSAGLTSPPAGGPFPGVTS